MDDNSAAAVADIERALVAIRRSQRRRTLSRLADRRTRPDRPDQRDRAGQARLPDALFVLLDAVEAARGRATVTELAAAMDVDQPRASRLAARALSEGLARRGVDPADGRRSPLALTAAGRRAVDSVHRFRREAVAAALRDWPPADRSTFAALLTRFVTDFARETAAPR